MRSVRALVAGRMGIWFAPIPVKFLPTARNIPSLSMIRALEYDLFCSNSSLISFWEYIIIDLRALPL